MHLFNLFVKAKEHLLRFSRTKPSWAYFIPRLRTLVVFFFISMIIFFSYILSMWLADNSAAGIYFHIQHA